MVELSKYRRKRKHLPYIQSIRRRKLLIEKTNPINRNKKKKRNRRREIIRELREIEGVNGAHSELFVVTSPVVERGQGEIIENQVSIKRVSIEPELVSKANSSHVRAWRLRRCRQRPILKIPDPWRGRRGWWSCHLREISVFRPQSVEFYRSHRSE